MKKMQDAELERINGGISGWVVAAIGAAIVFVSGIIDGIARPAKCRS